MLKQLHGLSDAQYGLIFLPQVAMAIVGSVSGGVLAKRLGLKNLLWLALLANGLSQLALAASAAMGGWAFASIFLGTALLGLGFGLSGAPLNSYPPAFFPQRRDSALVALHTALGVGLVGGPLLVGWFIHAGAWVGFPLLLLSASLLLLVAVLWVPLPQPAPVSVASHEAGARPLTAPSFWLFVAVAVLYAFAEGTFSNWAVLYLNEDKQLPQATAALALSVFWAALAAGRLLVSGLTLRVPAERIWLVLPVLMVSAFLLLPYANSAVLGIALFALAGLACSAFFPLTIGLASRAFPSHVAWVSSMMVAALMVGVGLGTFVIGPLRSALPLEHLYRLSALYPLLVLGLALVLLGSRARVMKS
jgi:fucose permease